MHNFAALLLSSAFATVQVQAQSLPPAPVERSNWAVARLDKQVYTFYGLGAGKTAADIAIEKGHAGLAELLIGQAGATSSGTSNNTRTDTRGTEEKAP